VLFNARYRISFGDCDPAGIVFYPNLVALMDRTFHAFIAERAGGHASLCRELGARGLGVMSTDIRFHSPAREGDLLDVAIAALEWAPRSFAIAYSARIGDQLVLESTETRGVFVETGGKLRAGEAAALRARLVAPELLEL